MFGNVLLPGVTVESVEGRRVATVLPQYFRPPTVGPAWANPQELAPPSPLRRLAALLSLVLRKGSVAAVFRTEQA